jgi:hypothetical protein
MSLTRLVIAGAVGGFLSIFTSWLITGNLFHGYQRLTPETWRPEGPKQYALSSLLQILEGAAVGALFFATGGLSSAPAATWLLRGLLFGSLAWLALACPVLLGSAIYVKLHSGVVVGLLLDSLFAVVLMSCACAWAA